MFFLKKIQKSNIKRTKATVVLLGAACIMTGIYAGCSLLKEPADPNGSAASSVPAVTEKESSYMDYVAGISVFDGNVSKYETGPYNENDICEYILAGKYVYNLFRSDEQYYLKRIDVAAPSRSGIAQIGCKKDYSCTLSAFGVRLENEDEVIFYDLDMNEIWKVPNTKYYEAIVPYKDSYLYLEGDQLYILKEGQKEPFRKLNLPDYGILCQKVTSENTILALTDNNMEGPYNFYVYDVNADTYKTINEMCFNYYENGYFDAYPEKIRIRNLSDEKEQEFENKYPGYIGTSYYDGQKIYFSDQTDLTIRTYDPVNKTIATLTEHEFGKYGVNMLGVIGKEVFFVYAGQLYVIDTTGCTEIPVEEFNIILHGNRDDLERVIRDKYSINILTGDAAAKHILRNVKCEPFNQETRILYTLKQITPYIERFGKEFFDEFRYGTSKGLYVLLTGHTEVTNDGAKIDAGGVAFREGDKFYIILNINNEGLAKSFCHELMHSMEQNSDASKFFPDWNKYNPKGYKYADSYAQTSDDKYTQWGSSPEDVYFYDQYSKTNAMEDRARVFENFVGVTKDECRIHEYPKLKEKAKYIKERILKLYPSLKGSDIFKNLDG